MAYVIGSQKGKDIAANMKAGETYKCSDGSTWTKKADGSVSVTTSSGQKFDNAYTPASTTSNSGSSGSKTTVPSGSSSNKTSSSGNSQYTPTTTTPTAPSNYSYTIGSDKGKDIANNMPIGSTYTASDGAIWTKNDDGTVSVSYKGQTYNNAYQMNDIGTLARQQMDAGLDWRILQDTSNQRVNKALGTEGLEQYAYDNIYHDIQQYIRDAKAAEQVNTPTYTATPGNAITNAQGWVNNYAQNNPQPTYESKYDPEIDRLLNEILNRDDFSYNAENDPLYQQFSAMYQREGDRAMRETLAEAAAGAGGMNTYAITAAQMAANNYAAQLGDKIPELYQLAYDMYLADKESKVQDLGLLQNADATQYNRYRDTMSDYKNDRNFAYGAYQDDVAQGNWQKTFDFNVMQDERDFGYNSYWDNTKWQANQGQIDLENSRYDQEQANAQIEYLISLGQTPSAELIAKSSWSKEETDNGWMNGLKDIAALVADSKVGKLGNGVESEEETDSTWTKGLTDLGLGLVYSPNLLVELAEMGAIYEANGTLKWANGWNAQNFQEKMSKTKAFNLLPTL